MANIASPSSEHPCNNIIQTKKDNQMKAALYQQLFGARIIDLRIEIENDYNVLKDPNSTNCEKKTSLSTIKNTIFSIPRLYCRGLHRIIKKPLTNPFSHVCS